MKEIIKKTKVLRRKASGWAIIQNDAVCEFITRDYKDAWGMLIFKNHRDAQKALDAENGRLYDWRIVRCFVNF